MANVVYKKKLHPWLHAKNNQLQLQAVKNSVTFKHMCLKSIKGGKQEMAGQSIMTLTASSLQRFLGSHLYCMVFSNQIFECCLLTLFS